MSDATETATKNGAVQAHDANGHIKVVWTALDAAIRYLDAGLSVVPIRADGTKAPSIPWDSLKTRRASVQQVEKWYSDNPDWGVGVIGGAVSGDLEHLDFDEDATEVFPAWCEMVERECPGLIARLSVRRTPGDGYHASYRCHEVPIAGNTKIAEKPNPNDPKKRLTVIETRGESGLVVAPGTPAHCHPAGRLYEHHSGPKLTKVQVISAAERAILWRCAASFDRMPAKERHGTGRSKSGRKGKSAGDDFCERGPDWPSLLEPHGWTLEYEKGSGRFWKRPGKAEKGHSATTGICVSEAGRELFYCFSSNAHPFEPNKPYSKFAVYTFLNYEGDFSAAAKELHARGFGEWDDYEEDQDGGDDCTPTPLPAEEPWPEPLAPEAYHGLAGEIVRAIEPHTEADPAAVLVQLLVAFGNVIERRAYFRAEEDRHYCNEFVALLGPTAKGRKGSSWSRVRKLFERVDGDWSRDRISSGLSSAEGLIWQVRDEIRKMVKKKGGQEEQVVDPGISDKRFLVQEPEFASVLKQAERSGNTLSAIMRMAWESGSLKSLTKNSPAQATGAHISIIGHCTIDECRRYLTTTEIGNGLANRFLWLCVKRSKSLPEGGRPDEAVMEQLASRLADAVGFARSVHEVERDAEAREDWFAVYESLSEGKPGMAGAMLARAEAHVMRLAVLYALLDQSECVRRVHLRAAIALWEYCEASVLHVFGDSTGDALADEILGLLKRSPDGCSKRDINKYLGNNGDKASIDRALGVLLKYGKAKRLEQKTAGRGRPAEVWSVVTAA